MANFMKNKFNILMLTAILFMSISCAAGTGTTKKADKGPVAISNVSLVGDGQSVLIETTGPVRYTAFEMSDPTRLVIDFPEVEINAAQELIEVDNVYATNINISSYGEGKNKTARVEVGLQNGIMHDVVAGDDGILVKMKKEIYMAGVSVPEEDDIIDESIGDDLSEQVGEDLEDMDAEVTPVEEPEAITFKEEDEVLEDITAEDAVSEDISEDELDSFLEEDEAEIVSEEAVEEVVSEEPVAIAQVEETVPAVDAEDIAIVLEDDLDLEEEAEEDEDVVEEDAEDVSEEPVEEAPVSAGIEAKTLLAISHEETNGDTIIKLDADGEITSFNSFGLEDGKPRLVVDIWGVKSDIGKKKYKVGSKLVRNVRMDEKTDKVRIVVDMQTSSLQNHLVEKSGDSLIIKLSKNAIEPTISEEMEMDEDTDEMLISDVKTGTVISRDKIYKVLNVDFKKIGRTGRLVIKNNGKTEYLVQDSADGKVVTLDIHNAQIPKDLRMTLDATDLGTTVDTISSYQLSTKPTKDVRIHIKLNTPVEYKVSEDGHNINIDFPITKAIMSKSKKSGEVTKTGYAGEEGGDSIWSSSSLSDIYPNKKVSLNFVDTDISDVFIILADVSNLNIITTDDVSGKLSMRLIDVPWHQAFDIILKAKNLDKVHEGNVIRVASIDTIKREKDAKLAAKKAQEKLEDLQTEYIRISYDEATKLEKQIKTLLTDRGSVTSHEPTNTLIIKDVQSAIDEVKDFIVRVDIQTPQVLIEARIVEAESSFARDLGIQWGVNQVKQGTNNSSHRVMYSSTSGTSPGYEDLVGGNTYSGTQNYAVNLPASGSAGTTGALGFLFGTAGSNPLLLDLRLTAGESQGLVKTISRPRITTLDNKEAKIQQGESIPFSTTSDSGTQTSFIDANLSLTVTPHITPDGSVLMKIKAARNSIGSFKSASGEPSINKKEATTEVIVKDGETTVIGGIVVSDTSRSEAGIPFLKSIPLIGWLFKNKSVSDTQRELLIFITPTILNKEESD